MVGDQAISMTDPTRVRTVRVLVDVTGIRRSFDYLVTGGDVDAVTVGTEVRVRLGPRSVRGWVTSLDVDSPVAARLQPIIGVRGIGPPPDMVSVAMWAAWRWAGHPAQLLRLASAPTVVGSLPAPVDRPMRDERAATGTADSQGLADLTRLAREAARPGGTVEGHDVGRPSVVRLAPAIDRIAFIVEVLAVAGGGAGDRSAVIACPSLRAASRLSAALRHEGFAVADLSVAGPASERAAAWARAAAGGQVVVGTRNAAWAPAPDPSVFVIVDEHDEAYRSERAPTWHARDVLGERAARAEVPFVQLSPCPSLEALESSRLLTTRPDAERAGWPRLQVIDRCDDDPRLASSLFSEPLGRLLESSGRTLCVLNRTGRARMLACRSCGALACCERCGAAVHAPVDTELSCSRCETRRPRVCSACGSAALKNLRIGVARAQEELAALIGEPVAGPDDATGDHGSTRVAIGTEALLHRSGRADTVVFLDFDQELTAPRFRAAEQAMVLLARAARIVGGRAGDGRLVVQTRLATHPVLAAVEAGDPGRLVAGERQVRESLGFPPFAALAMVSGAGAAEFVAGLRAVSPAVDLLEGGDGTWLIRAADHDGLADALAIPVRPEERLRIEVDPARV